MLLCDGHVHLEHQDRFPELLDTCLCNMKKAIPESSGTQRLQGILLMAELPGQSWRAELLDRAEKRGNVGRTKTWSLRRADQGAHIICENDNGDQLVCLTGQQVATSENLELLLFGHEEPYRPESLLKSVEKNVKQADLVVVPWGVGKWLGARGEKVLELLGREDISGYVLGDNGNRPAAWKKIPQFDIARKRGIPIVAGTDPLFLSGQIKRVGTYGMLVSEESERCFSTSEIRELLQNNNSMKTYGALQRLHSFVAVQIALRVKKARSK